MEQMNTDGLEVIRLDYHSPALPGNVQKLKPTLYKNGSSFYCLLGPDTQTGIVGCGETPDEAINVWNANLKDWIVNHPYGDELADFVMGRLASI